MVYDQYGHIMTFDLVAIISSVIYVRVVQLEEAWTVNRVVGRSSSSWVKLTKSLQQVFNYKISGSFGSKLGGPVCRNNIVGTLMIHLCPSHIGHVLRLPGSVSPPNYTDSSSSGRY